jgi:glycosyltransferase involved in cell wall biosynthesis
MEKGLISIIIPSRKEKFLNQTVNDVLAKSRGKIEVFVILDGYDLPETELINDSRLKYIRLPYSVQMTKRIGVNEAVKQANGEFVMALDAHCMMAEGFDVVLARDCEDNMIMIPRRYKLDPERWAINPRWQPIDYEYWMWQPLKEGHYFKNYGWSGRKNDRKDIMIDDTLTFQGSCWIMKKTYFEKMNYMRIEGYTAWGQEDVELTLECWSTGGRVVVNKNTYYCHLFKGKVYGRMYRSNYNQHSESRRFAYDYWVNKNMDRLAPVMNKFMPIPNFPKDWQAQLKAEEGKVYGHMVLQ